MEFRIDDTFTDSLARFDDETISARSLGGLRAIVNGGNAPGGTA
jgi:hypothetical protein